MMEQQYESNFYIAAMQSISSLGAATIRDLVEKFGNPYEAWCALQNRKNLTTILGIPSTKYRRPTNDYGLSIRLLKTGI